MCDVGQQRATLLLLQWASHCVHGNDGSPVPHLSLSGSVWYVGYHLVRVAFGCVTYQVRFMNLEQCMSTAESVSPALTVAVRRNSSLHSVSKVISAPGLAKTAKWKATSLFCCVPQSLPEDLSQANYYTMWTVTLLMGLGSAGTSLGS